MRRVGDERTFEFYTYDKHGLLLNRTCFLLESGRRRQ